MASKKGRILFSTKVEKYDNPELYVGVYGIFKSTDSATGNWKYYLISYFLKNNSIQLRNEWHPYYMEATYNNIESHSKSVQSVEEGKKICEEYKSKWETGSNDTLQHKRDEKLTEILGDK
jgi:intein/homing endonuclease